MRAVGRDEVVVVAQRARRADDRRLLADREVQEAADLRLRVHLAGALLEAADEHHRRAATRARRRARGAGGRPSSARYRSDDPAPAARPDGSTMLRYASRSAGPRRRGVGPAGASGALARVGAARARRVGARRRRGARRRARRGAAAGRRADPRGGDARRPAAARGRGASAPSRSTTRCERLAGGGCEVATTLRAPARARAGARGDLRPGRGAARAPPRARRRSTVRRPARDRRSVVARRRRWWGGPMSIRPPRGRAGRPRRPRRASAAPAPPGDAPRVPTLVATAAARLPRRRFAPRPQAAAPG